MSNFYTFKPIVYISLVIYTTSFMSHALSDQTKQVFPGVSRDLASFCAARPSLPVELASMVVHVKKDTSFNYKLYLFSADHVFQTGQIVPRDDFRIHSFPVRFKQLAEFWPASLKIYQVSNSTKLLTQISSSAFNLKEFLKRVPLNPDEDKLNNSNKKVVSYKHKEPPPEDLVGDLLPGDSTSLSKDESSSKNNEEPDFNEHILFDRDDQVSPAINMKTPTIPQSYNQLNELKNSSLLDVSSSFITPVGSFSSFHVNLTYLVRKDFGQTDAQLIRIQIDAYEFKVTQVVVINTDRQTLPKNDDYSFLMHDSLRDPRVRITSINQIYEDWITRNFYTIVYIQRKLEGKTPTIANERLIFRGASVNLLGADQLDYSVKAAAFITEKNGLHYYLEFLPTNKFHLGAVDWSRRPFMMIDFKQFPIRATRSQLDNEELLLCPPAVCYSNQPIDEVVSYGRLPISDHQQESINKFISSDTQSSNLMRRKLQSKLNANLRDTLSSLDGSLKNDDISDTELIDLSKHLASLGGHNVDLDEIISYVKSTAANNLETKLHLRDWSWHLERPKRLLNKFKVDDPNVNMKLIWRYEMARRNDIKAKQDFYGYVLTGHEIYASYRVYNELYLISANNLITINYTLANETVTSSQPIDDEFIGLSSSLIDPITAAFYDRYTNQVFFFKGDRYIGYDYAKRRPLEDFRLQSPIDTSTLIVSSLPVAEILGRQHQVDGIYHDFSSDLVYIFFGMQFYTFQANEFKDGMFRPRGESLPPIYCINKLFLDGCNFDIAYPNPCHVGEYSINAKLSQPEINKEFRDTNQKEKETYIVDTNINYNQANFTEEQQSRLRSIASRNGFLDVLIGNNLIKKGADQFFEQLAGSDSRPHDRIIIYLLMAMLVLTILFIIAIIIAIINWAQVTIKNDNKVTEVKTRTSMTNTNKLEQQQSLNAADYLARIRLPQYQSHQQYLNSTKTRLGSEALAFRQLGTPTPSLIQSKTLKNQRRSYVDSSIL